jgi:hypothetical protein
LLPHVINLSRGELSEKGEFKTTPQSLRDLVDSVASHLAQSKDPRIVLYAHGGLVKEHLALQYADKIRTWWLEHGVYPIFFVWETGLLETIGQYLVGPRDIYDYTSDPLIEIAAKLPGSAVWGGMKESARRASLPDTGQGTPGGAFLFVDALVRMLDGLPGGKGAATEIHAVGHSAGSIFHSHLLPLLIGRKRTVKSVSFLAPAVRTKLFSAQLLPHVAKGDISKLSMFTMEDDAERQDNCANVYHKSLLYLVSRSFEGLLRAPILGLERSIKKDDTLAKLFGVDGTPPAAELQLSYARGSTPNPETDALHHGDFDNNRATMCAVLRRIHGLPNTDDIGKDGSRVRILRSAARCFRKRGPDGAERASRDRRPRRTAHGAVHRHQRLPAQPLGRVRGRRPFLEGRPGITRVFGEDALRRRGHARGDGRWNPGTCGRSTGGRRHRPAVRRPRDAASRRERGRGGRIRRGPCSGRLRLRSFPDRRRSRLHPLGPRAQERHGAR